MNRAKRVRAIASMKRIMDGLEELAKEDGVQRGIFIDTSGMVRSERVSSTAIHTWLHKTEAGKPFVWNSPS